MHGLQTGAALINFRHATIDDAHGARTHTRSPLIDARARDLSIEQWLLFRRALPSSIYYRNSQLTAARSPRRRLTELRRCNFSFPMVRCATPGKEIERNSSKLQQLFGHTVMRTVGRVRGVHQNRKNHGVDGNRQPDDDFLWTEYSHKMHSNGIALQ